MYDNQSVPIKSDRDIVIARQHGRTYASKIGFTGGDLTLIATAISELARNIVEYAKQGEIVLSSIQQGGQAGICIVARDEGPGIVDIVQAMEDGYSSRRSLGLGLPGTKRIVDEFEIVSNSGKGTTVTVKKWLR
ncbi:MAG: anti-sigma regulatory factor [Ignavibacteriae bacterium]|nr:anti-sigma regulatory factor [Ignavibacteriota bacterium]